MKVWGTFAIALALLTGATSVSHVTYTLTFASPEATSSALRAAAREALTQEGFGLAAPYAITPDPTELQLPGRAIAAVVESAAPGNVTVTFTQLRGGCSNFSDIEETKGPFARARERLERRFGASELNVRSGRGFRDKAI